MNRDIMDLCKLAGIDEEIRITTYKGSTRTDSVYQKWEKVGTHTGRRTFIVNALSLVGDFFKDLDITEGKSTGIPTITAAMKANGSPAVKYDFDDSYSWFMATVPVHPVFLNDTDSDRKETINSYKLLTERRLSILSLIEKDDRITTEEIHLHLNVSVPTINRDIAVLKKEGYLVRVKGKKDGSWFIARRIKLSLGHASCVAIFCGGAISTFGSYFAVEA